MTAVLFPFARPSVLLNATFVPWPPRRAGSVHTLTPEWSGAPASETRMRFVTGTRTDNFPDRTFTCKRHGPFRGAHSNPCLVAVAFSPNFPTVSRAGRLEEVRQDSNTHDSVPQNI